MAERIAVVTGANRGIGLEICRQLAALGITVVLTSRDPAKGEAACAMLAGAGSKVVFHALDVGEPESAGALAGWLDARFGRLDILVNNAGVLIDPRGGRALTLEPAVLRETLAANLYGPLCVTQRLAPLMQRHGYGRIVNMSSLLGQLQGMTTGTPAYRISKAALNALTRILSAELAATGIKVNTMSPGWVRTDMGGPGAAKSVAEGADTAVWLATLPDDGPTGGFFADRKPVPW